MTDAKGEQMSAIKNKMLCVTMENGEEWAVPVSVIANRNARVAGND